MLRVGVIAGERGGFVRAAPLLAELRRRSGFESHFIFAGEEYAPWAACELFRDLDLPFADAVIGASEGTPAARLSKVIAACERLVARGEYAAMVLVGHSHTLLGCALACAWSPVVLAHTDAGLRLPGIAGRTSLGAQIDRLANLLFAISEPAHDRLLDEGRPEEAVVLTGALACDAAAACLERARACDAPARAGMQPKEFALVAVGSADTIEHVANLTRLVELLSRVHAQLPVALCIHERLMQRLKEWQLVPALAELAHLSWVEPRGYIEFLALLDAARVVLTDIGGVQEEALFLGIPCLALMESASRAGAAAEGSSAPAGLDPEEVEQAVAGIMANQYPRAEPPVAWDGRASIRIADALAHRLRQG